jgi:cation diffusion facilitator family transporter
MKPVATLRPVDNPVSAGAGLSGSERVVYAAMAGDCAVAISKFVAAAMTGSSAMLAEGVHSLVDAGNEMLLLTGLRHSRRAADEWHPFGYGKAAYFWALIVALCVFSLGGGISIYQGVANLLHPPALEDPTWNYIVLAVAALFEASTWRLSRRELGRHRRPGDSLWQAVRRSKDAAVYTVFVEDSASLAGLAMAALGVWLSHRLGNPYFDPIASVLIGITLIGAAVLLARESGALLLGEGIDREQIAQLRRLIGADAAVEGVSHLLTMQLGPDSVLLTAAVRFRRACTLDQVEQAIERIEQAIRLHNPSIRHLFLESGALKTLARQVPPFDPVPLAP